MACPPTAAGAVIGNRGARLRTFTANYQMLEPGEYADSLFEMDDQGTLQQMLFVPNPDVYDPNRFAILRHLWTKFPTHPGALSRPQAGRSPLQRQAKAMQEANRVAVTATTTGTGSFTLAGAILGHQTFGTALGTGGNTEVYYGIVHDANGTWEIGIGHLPWTGSNQLQRDTRCWTGAPGDRRSPLRQAIRPSTSRGSPTRR